MKQRVIGIDIGGTKIAAALVAADGHCHEIQQCATPVSQGPTAIVRSVTELARRLLEVASEQGLEVIAVGAGTGGQVDVGTGVITYAVDTLPGWTGTPLAGELQDALGLHVTVDNDVNAMAIGEHRFGTGKDLGSALYVAVGTGIGGALIFNGQLWRGVHWSAGELGHTIAVWDGDRMCNCGQRGHLEAYASGPAIAKAYFRQRGLPESSDLRTVIQQAEAGDVLAREAIHEGAQILGAVLGGLVNVFDPEGVIVGGGVAQLGAIWREPFEQALRANPLPGPQDVQVRYAHLGTNAVLVGAAQLAWERIG